MGLALAQPRFVSMSRSCYVSGYQLLAGPTVWKRLLPSGPASAASQVHLVGHSLDAGHATGWTFLGLVKLFLGSPVHFTSVWLDVRCPGADSNPVTYPQDLTISLGQPSSKGALWRIVGKCCNTLPGQTWTLLHPFPPPPLGLLYLFIIPQVWTGLLEILGGTVLS